MWPLLAAALLLVQTPDYSADGIKALEEGKYEAAVQAFTKAIEVDPKDYFAHFNLAFAYGALKKDPEAIAEYRKTLELKPGLYEAELNGGIVFMRQKQPADALPLLAHAVEQKPSEFRPRYYLAEAQYQTGAYSDAEANYRLALEIDAKSAAAEFGLAHALVKEGKLADAAPHYRQAAQLDPRYHDDLLELAQFYEQNHQMDEAIAIYREFPANPAAQEHLGQLMLESKQYADAIPRLETAFQQSPTEANRVALAAAYLFANQLEKALPLLEKAAAEEPANYDIRMMYARALRDRKQFPAAAAQFYEAAKLKPAGSEDLERARRHALHDGRRRGEDRPAARCRNVSAVAGGVRPGARFGRRHPRQLVLTCDHSRQAEAIEARAGSVPAISCRKPGKEPRPGVPGAAEGQDFAAGTGEAVMQRGWQTAVLAMCLAAAGSLRAD